MTWIFDTNIAGKVSATTKRGRTAKSKPAEKLKPAPKAVKSSSPRRLCLMWSKPIVVDGPSDVSTGSTQEKSAPVVGVKRKAAEEAPNPHLPKRPIVEGSIPPVGELDQLAAILNGTWDKVVEAREAVSVAEGCL